MSSDILIFRFPPNQNHAPHRYRPSGRASRLYGATGVRDPELQV